MMACKDCHWAQPAELDGHIVCRFPLPDWVMRALHDPLQGGGRFSSSMNQYDGIECPCFLKKEVHP